MDIKQQESSLIEEVSFKTQNFVLIQVRPTKLGVRTRVATNCDELTKAQRRKVIDDLRLLAANLEQQKDLTQIAKPITGCIAIAKSTRHGLGDIGASGLTYETEYFIKDKEYEVIRTYEAQSGLCIIINGEDGRMGFSSSDFDFYTKQ